MSILPIRPKIAASVPGPLQPPSLRSQHFADSAPVLKGRRTRPTEFLLPTFGDDVWDLRPAIHRANQRRNCIIDFTCISDPVRRLSAKEFLYAALNKRLPGSAKGAARKHPDTAYLWFRDLLLFWKFLDKRYDRARLDEVTQGTLDIYLEEARTNEITGDEVQLSRLGGKIAVIGRLYAYRGYLTHDRLTFAPWGGRTASDVAGDTASEENGTPRIPEPVMGPMLHWALRYVEDFAPEILAARRDAQQRPLIARSAVPTRTGSKREPVTVALLQEWVAHRRAQGSGIPRHQEGTRMHGRLQNRVRAGDNVDLVEYANLNRIAQEIGVGYTSLARPGRTLELLRAAIESLGWEGDLDTRLPEDAEVTLTNLRGPLYGEVLLTEEKMLVAACYLVIGYLTGMRDSEVISLQVGCHRPVRNSDGSIHRHKVRGRVYKKQHAEGEEVEWVAIEPVAHAIAVVEDLLELHRQNDDGCLLTMPHGGGKGKPLRPSRHLDQFRYHVNRLARRHPGLPCVPDHQGEPWKFNSMQLRRTLAWYIANRPYGIVALKKQYKHVHIRASEGYAGTSESGFAKEIEMARLYGEGEDLLDRFRDFCDGVRLGGPGAPRIHLEFERIRREIGGSFPVLLADQARVRAMLMNSEATLYVGLYNDCYYVSGTALCLQGKAETERAEPLLLLCSPTLCPNSCYGRRQREMWDRSRSEAEEYLKNPRLPVLQRVGLTREVARIREVLTEIDENTNGG